MKKKILLIFIIIITIVTFISGCNKSNDKNKVDIVKTNNYEINLKKILDLRGIADDSSKANLETSFSSISFFSVDTDGNIFIVDERKSIKKFDNKGNFVTSFGKIGKGPGEFQSIYGLSILNDTIYVTDFPATLLVHMFNNDGEFISTLKLKQRAPEFVKQINKSKMAAFNLIHERVETGFIIHGQIAVFDNKEFNKDKILSVDKINYDPRNPKINPTDFIPAFTVNKNNGEVFVAKISENDYRINVYDSKTFEKKYYLSKTHRKSKMNKDEHSQLSASISNGPGENEDRQNKVQDAYKKAINFLHVDKNNYVWVNSSREFPEGYNGDDLRFDIFKDGKFINTLSIKELKIIPDFSYTHQIAFFGNYLYVNNDNESLSIYKY